MFLSSVYQVVCIPSKQFNGIGENILGIDVNSTRFSACVAVDGSNTWEVFNICLRKKRDENQTNMKDTFKLMLITEGIFQLLLLFADASHGV